MGYPVIFYFKSQYCSPCVSVEAMLNDINLSLFGNRLNVRKIDIQQEMELAKKYNILSVPTILIGNVRLSIIIDKNELTDAILQGFLSSISFEDDPPVPTEIELPDLADIIASPESVSSEQFSSKLEASCEDCSNNEGMPINIEPEMEPHKISLESSKKSRTKSH
jgi:thiol-disulfide isomerase/thioredoxin